MLISLPQSEAKSPLKKHVSKSSIYNGNHQAAVDEHMQMCLDWDGRWQMFPSVKTQQWVDSELSQWLSESD